MPDASTPAEETLRTLDDMVRSGTVRYIGCSNYSGWALVESMWISKTEHLTPFISAQNQYNMLDRSIESELAPACLKYGVGVLPYFPLASGFLTGKYRQDAPLPEGARLSAPNSPMAARILSDENYEKLTRLEDFAEARGHTMIELAIGWLASKPYVGSVIAGATRPEQVEQNARSADWKLSDEEMKLVDEILEHKALDPGGRRT
jgi:aryl-alcohol dehydrogenase-like predicted oxidoreductase